MSELTNISDEFTEPTGMFTEYAPVASSQEEQLRKQKHVNIRSFVPDTPSGTVRMLQMDRLNMFYLDGKQISTFSGAKIVVINNEGWTLGSVTQQTDRNMWTGIKLNVPKEVVVATISVISQNG